MKHFLMITVLASLFSFSAFAEELASTDCEWSNQDDRSVVSDKTNPDVRPATKSKSTSAQ